jgi:hypothetical protein
MGAHARLMRAHAQNFKNMRFAYEFLELMRTAYDHNMDYRRLLETFRTTARTTPTKVLSPLIISNDKRHFDGNIAEKRFQNQPWTNHKVF